jgi:CopG antitoxin of type II toxin-antitoxin system
MSNEPTYRGPAYPTQAHGSIPAFNSYEEEAAFWDTHSTTDFTNETEAVIVSATRGLSANVQVRFDPDTDHELEALARERGIKNPPSDVGTRTATPGPQPTRLIITTTPQGKESEQ